MNRFRRQGTAWLATLAIALYALWPLVSQAKPRTAGPLVPVCTVEGVTHYIELPAGKSPLDEKSKAQHEHCSFCFSGGDRAALASEPDATPLAETSADAGPLTAEPLAVRPRSFAPGNPRAPPAAS